MRHMHRVRLPKSELELSVIGFGCWTIGGAPWGAANDADSVAAIHAALERGVNWFDTAPLYGHGHADEVLGRALRGREALIASKVGVRFDPVRDKTESDLSAEHVRADCEASLRRLGVESLDLLQVHWPCDRGTALDETLGALERLREEGKIREWGLCNYNDAGLGAALERGPVATLQTPYSMVRREFESSLCERCARAGVAVLAYETLCRGLLTDKYQTLPRFRESDLRSHDPRFWGAHFLRNQHLARQLGRLAIRLGTTPEALAIGWTLRKPPVAAAIVGIRNVAQLERNVEAARWLQRSELWERIDAHL